MIKKIILVFVILSISIILLCGCATVTYNNITNTDGSIKQEFVIEIDEGNDMTILVPLQLMFKDLNYSVTKSAESPNKLIASRDFSGLTEYYQFYGITGDETEESSAEVISGFWFNKIKSTMQTVFADLNDEEFVEPFYKKYFIGYDINALKNVEFFYNYGTKYATVYGEDADFKTENNGVYLYSWRLTYDNLDRQITLVQISPNSTVWYTVAIVGSLVLIALLVIISKILIKRKGTKEKING